MTDARKELDILKKLLNDKKIANTELKGDNLTLLQGVYNDLENMYELRSRLYNYGIKEGGKK